MNVPARAPLAPEIVETIERFEKLMGETELDVQKMRQVYRSVMSEQGQAKDPVKTRDLLVPTRHGSVSARLYTPLPEVPRPLILYIHGGGFMVGDLDSVDLALHRVSRGADVAILSIDYSLAPEHKYPVALEQCQDALTWATTNAKALGGAKGIGIAGDSAGGNLSALLAMWARDHTNIEIVWQGLVNPVLDFHGVVNARTESHVVYADGPVLSSVVMNYFIDQYFSDREKLTEASPLLRGDLSGLPQAFIAVGECDPLRDEGLEYAERLKAAGAKVTAKLYKGMAHNFITLTHLSETASGFVDDFTRAARAALHPGQ